MRAVLIATMLSLLPTFADAGDRGPAAAPSPRETYVTSTGETVDTPGQSHSAGTTKMDRSIERQNNRIDDSICKGC